MIDRELAAFLQEGLGIHIGTRNERLEPNGARAGAVQVDEDGVHLIVYVPEVAAPRVLPDLQSNGQATVGFARPVDDKACQVKGVFVERAAGARGRARAGDGAVGGLSRQPGKDRHPARRAWIDGSTWPSVAIRLRATALFNQTPGPSAGAPLP